MPIVVTAATLGSIMEFDHVICVDEDGMVSEPDGVYAPEVYCDPEDYRATDAGNAWVLLSGYSGQYNYSGPWMHPSELIAGKMAEDILADAAYYVAVYDDDSWAVARKSL